MGKLLQGEILARKICYTFSGALDKAPYTNIGFTMFTSPQKAQIDDYATFFLQWDCRGYNIDQYRPGLQKHVIWCLLENSVLREGDLLGVRIEPRDKDRERERESKTPPYQRVLFFNPKNRTPDILFDEDTVRISLAAIDQDIVEMEFIKARIGDTADVQRVRKLGTLEHVALFDSLLKDGRDVSNKSKSLTALTGTAFQESVKVFAEKLDQVITETNMLEVMTLDRFKEEVLSAVSLRL